ncbi:MAG: DNA polymerase III subunit delta', partial [Deltaproteobacteria bacterium]
MPYTTFSGILGQEKAKNFLKEVVRRGKVPHAYLFTGISGIGKTVAAKALALALNCRDPAEGESCGHCPSCRQLGGENVPDFIVIKPQGQTIKIEQIRELNRALGFAPVVGKYRICLVKQAETMTGEAANSFLKTLEEPPPGNILILNATEPRDLLPTIVSRCQRVPFHPLRERQVAWWLVKKKGLKEETATVLARISGGSLGRALSMCESDFFEKRQDWISRLTALPDLSLDKTMTLALDCAKEHKKGPSDRSDAGESGVSEMLGIWMGWYRDLLVLKVGGESHLLVNPDFSHKLKIVARGFTMERLTQSLGLLDQAERG